MGKQEIIMQRLESVDDLRQLNSGDIVSLNEGSGYFEVKYINSGPIHHYFRRSGKNGRICIPEYAIKIDEGMIISLEKRIKKIVNLDELDNLKEGDLIINNNSLGRKPKLRVYEGVVDGKLAFMERGITEGHISSWQIRGDLCGLNVWGGICLDAASEKWRVYTPATKNYLEKLNILEKSGL